MINLLRRVETYGADTKTELDKIIEELTAAGGEVTKKVIETKQRKSKGEIIDERYRMTVQIDYLGLWDSPEDDDAIENLMESLEK